jgi:phosphatidate cytidylyltransferase
VGGTFLLGFDLLFGAPGFADGWSPAVVLTVCGAATVFWILVAAPWIALAWPTRSQILLALVGWLILIAAWLALVELQARSPWLVLAAMGVVWIADTAAYFAGRAFGRHKLAPHVSPGKTWEGVIGALVGVAVYAAALVPFAVRAGYRGPVDAATIALWLVFVAVLAAVSVIGDLFESMLKRHAGVKDSGHLLPGHGGVLDRTDALLAAMPPAALAALLFLDKQ